MKIVALIAWMLISLALVCSVIGLLLFIPKDMKSYEDNTPSTWNTIGLKLLESVIK